MVLKNTGYTSVSPIVHARPVHLGPNPLIGGTNYATISSRENYRQQIRLFQETNSVEECLLKKLADALPLIYLDCYGGRILEKINTNIRNILANLMQQYGFFADEEIKQKGNDLNTRVFNITQPPEHIYKTVRKLNELATASNKPYTEH